MRPESVKKLLLGAVPFIGTIGVRIDEVGPGTATASLPSRWEVHNHLGTAHAGAVYTLAETASGAVVLSIFGDLMPQIFIALRSAEVQHTAAKKGDVVARARLRGDPAAARAAYEAEGRADLDVAVELSVGESPTARVILSWAVRAPR